MIETVVDPSVRVIGSASRCATCSRGLSSCVRITIDPSYGETGHAGGAIRQILGQRRVATLRKNGTPTEADRWAPCSIRMAAVQWV